MDNESDERMFQNIILQQPHGFIGTISTVTENIWVYDEGNKKMIQREIKYAPGLYTIFDSILLTAANNNKRRDKDKYTIEIKINADDNTISVWNSGRGLPIVFNREKNMHEPSIIFGHLSNYYDGSDVVTGIENGSDAILCNLFSVSFTVETASKDHGKSFKQTWTDNMSNTSEAKIEKYGGDDFTRVTFSPDLKRFNKEKLDNDIVDLMTRRAYDLVASLKDVKVYLNDKLIPDINFGEYCKLYIRDKYDDYGEPLELACQSCGSRWQVALTFSNAGFKQVSFVNSIATRDGGKHVEYVTKLIVSALCDLIKQKFHHDLPITDDDIKESMWIFINCLIDDPEFVSLAQDEMISKVENFCSTFEISEEFENSMHRIGIIESVISCGIHKAMLKFQSMKERSPELKFKRKRLLLDHHHDSDSDYDEMSSLSEYEDDGCCG